MLNGKIKQLLIKVYKAKLSDAWARINQKGATKKKRKKKMVTEQMSGSNQALEEEIRATKERADTEEVRSGNKGKHKF